MVFFGVIVSVVKLAGPLQDDSWQVISSHFRTKGLVRQQLVRARRLRANDIFLRGRAIVLSTPYAAGFI